VNLVNVEVAEVNIYCTVLPSLTAPLSLDFICVLLVVMLFTEELRFVNRSCFLKVLVKQHDLRNFDGRLF